jgi:hypothetical protein
VELKKKVMKVETDNGGPSFFSDTVTVSHSTKKFVLDFQQITPRFSKIGPGELDNKMVVSHNTVMLDPEVAKDLSRILTDNVGRYEEKFGTLQIKKEKKFPVEKEDKVEYTSYIG